MMQRMHVGCEIPDARYAFCVPLLVVIVYVHHYH